MYDGALFQDSVSGSNGTPTSPLMQMLLCNNIVPGTDPGYQMCKTIYAYHPLGAKLTETPITRAQSMPRVISVTGLAEQRIVEQYQKTWDGISRVGATVVLHNLMSTSRIYGIASLAVGERGKDPGTPIDIAKIADADLYFNVLDPLNTAGSLVLNQDPNSPDFLKPKEIRVQGKAYHPSRTLIKMNEQPLYIQWTPASFGFVGRSIYQRALYPLQTFLQTMITDDMVAKKAGLLIAKMQSPGSFIDNIMQTMFGAKRGMLKSGMTGQVLQIGTEEDVESLNFQNLDGPYKIVRENVLKNIASAADMPASIINNETLAEGFGEGSEDAKEIVRYLNWIREDMAPAYAFMDRIVQRKAWTPAFHATLKIDYPELPDFEVWFHDCVRAFSSEWPNLEIEPDSEKSKNDDVKMKSAIAVAEVILPAASDPTNKAAVLMWLADNVNNSEHLFASKLVLDETAMIEGFEKSEQQAEEAMLQGGEEGETTEEKPPRPFSVAS